MKVLRLSVIAGVLPFLVMGPTGVYAQGQPPAPPLGQAQPMPQQQVPAYSQEQLDQMLAPIALYPDQLLTQILMASTYPLECVEAYRWVQDPNNARLQGDQLVATLQPLSWDPSVKSVVPFPQILKMLNDNLDWTQALGNAFANQQTDVMNEVQHLRQQAQAAGQLKSSPQMVVQDQGGAIAIAPPDQQNLYVPVYDPSTVYGAWPYPAYPPVYLPPPPGFVAAGFGVGVGIGFSVGFGIGAFGPLWGWASPAWGAGSVNVNVNRVTNISNTTIVNNRYGGGQWHHAPGPVGPAGFHPPGPGGFRPSGQGGYHPPGGGPGHPGGPGYRPPGGAGHAPGGGPGHPPGGAGFHPPAGGGHPGGTPAYRPPSGGGHPPSGGGHPPSGGGGHPGFRPAGSAGHPPPGGGHPPGGGGGGHPPPGGGHPGGGGGHPAGKKPG